MKTTDTPSLSSRISSAIYEPVLALGERRGMRDRRADLLARARGRVLEIGAGTGLNLSHYPPGLDEVVITEPEPGMRARLARRAARDGRDVRVVDAGADALPFEDASFDTVVSTLVLCTVPDAGDAIAEIRRVLRPDGQLLFIEHVLSDDPRRSRWQQRLAAPWAIWAEGCRCDRETVSALRSGGLALDELISDEWRGMPRIVGPLAIGRATLA
ncbi:MAG: class I SAM-dependent methyltransferase [Solirubrobacteraceae bacterium]|nr:class I SAM-dependent methyltransferase [Solirubrobacteraceae bacterium]